MLGPYADIDGSPLDRRSVGASGTYATDVSADVDPRADPPTLTGYGALRKRARAFGITADSARHRPNYSVSITMSETTRFQVSCPYSVL